MTQDIRKGDTVISPTVGSNLRRFETPFLFKVLAKAVDRNTLANVLCDLAATTANGDLGAVESDAARVISEVLTDVAENTYGSDFDAFYEGCNILKPCKEERP